jgi:hypothetical protein
VKGKKSLDMKGRLPSSESSCPTIEELFNTSIPRRKRRKALSQNSQSSTNSRLNLDCGDSDQDRGDNNNDDDNVDDDDDDDDDTNSSSGDILSQVQ